MLSDYVESLTSEIKRHIKQNIFVSLIFIEVENSKDIDSEVELLRKNYRIVDHIHKVSDKIIGFILPLTDEEGATAAASRAENFIFSKFKVKVVPLFKDNLSYDLDEEIYRQILKGEFDLSLYDFDEVVQFLVAFAHKFKEEYERENKNLIIDKGEMPTLDFKEFLDFEIRRSLRYNLVFTLFLIKGVDSPKEILERINLRLKFGDIFGVIEKKYIFLIYYGCDHYASKEAFQKIVEILKIDEKNIKKVSFPKDAITSEEMLGYLFAENN